MAKLTDPAQKKALIARLARIEGQLRGLQKSFSAEADCELLAQQLSATRKALDKAFFVMIACALEQEQIPATRVAKLLSKYA